MVTELSFGLGIFWKQTGSGDLAGYIPRYLGWILTRDVYANTEIGKNSEYGAAVSNAYMRKQVFGTGVRLVTAATMAGYDSLSEIEHGVIVGAREM